MRLLPTALLLAGAFSLTGCAQAYAASPAPRAMTRPAAKAAPIKQATPAEAAKFLQATPGAQFVDVRTPEEYAEGRAKGTVSRPLAELPQWAGSLDKNKPVVLICRSGSRSMKAATALAEKGFGQLINVQGGTLGWEADQLPMDR